MGSANSTLGELLMRNSTLFQRSSSVFPQFRIENFRVNDIKLRTIARILNKIINHAPFSLVAQLGLVLKNIKSGEYRFFYPGTQFLLRYNFFSYKFSLHC